MMESVPNKIVLTRWLGRFGNRLFTYTFASHLAAKFGLKVFAPSEWKGPDYFGTRRNGISLPTIPCA